MFTRGSCDGNNRKIPKKILPVWKTVLRNTQLSLNYSIEPIREEKVFLHTPAYHQGAEALAILIN